MLAYVGTNDAPHLLGLVDRNTPCCDGPMAPLSQTMALSSATSVALGAIFGACIRYAATQVGASRWCLRHWATWGVNISACFLMGLLVGLQPRWASSTQATLELAVATGLLGSMSTFSSLMAELVRAWQKRERRQALALGTASLLGGLLACQLGLSLGQARP